MQWLESTYTELAQLDRSKTVVILPVGAIEAHGPHLPLGTDGILAEGMARSAAAKVKEHGLGAVILPTYHWTVAGFAEDFPGTLSFAASNVVHWLRDLTRSLAQQGWMALAIANAHLDPGHLECLRMGLDDPPLPVIFPNLARRRWAQRLTAEFQSGACHAGQYEGSMVLALRPDLVRQEVAAQLDDNPHSLVEAIQAGKSTFAQAGGPQAYFGSPRQASAHEGLQSLDTLGQILLEAILESRGKGTPC